MQEPTYQDRVQSYVHRLLNDRIDHSPYKDNTDTATRVCYELGLLVGVVAQLSQDDSLVLDRVRAILSDPAVKD